MYTQGSKSNNLVPRSCCMRLERKGRVANHRYISDLGYVRVVRSAPENMPTTYPLVHCCREIALPGPEGFLALWGFLLHSCHKQEQAPR